jgi:hypothetical protein
VYLKVCCILFCVALFTCINVIIIANFVANVQKCFTVLLLLLLLLSSSSSLSSAAAAAALNFTKYEHD